MANNPYNVRCTADETKSVKKRKFVVFVQSLFNKNEKKSILIFQYMEMSVFTTNVKHIANMLNFHIYIYDNNNLVPLRRLTY
jgi:hypothetical protein